MSVFPEKVAEATRKIFQDTKIGEVFWISTTILTDAIGAAGTLILTQASTLGKLVIEDVIVQTGNGIGGVGTFKLFTNNATGSVAFFSENIANLGSSKTVDLAGARLKELLIFQADDTGVTAERANTRTVLEQGARVELQLSGAATGEGNFDVFIKFRRLSEGANILNI